MSDGDAERLRVVVVDDEPDVVLLLGLQLPRVGFEVVGSATDGSEAVRVCAAQQPDAIVLDLLMPYTPGFLAIEPLREAVPGVGVVAYSAVAGDFVRAEMARLDVPLVLKSGDVEPLAAALRAEVARQRTRSGA